MDDLFSVFKQKLKSKEAITVLLLINVAVFFLFTFLRISVNLSNGNVVALSIFSFFENIFSFKINPLFFATHPWTIVTSIFTHFNFWHIFSNMLVFYFVAKLFVYFFGERKLWWIYLLGGIGGNLLELLAGFIFTGANNGISVIGASGSVMAIFIAVSIYQPKFTVKLFGLFDIKIIYLAAFYFLYDFTRIGFNDGVAHFAHLGGALIGFISARNVTSSHNILNWLDNQWNKLIVKKSFRMKKPIRTSRPVTDEDFNRHRKEDQERTDAILDKISKYGYDGLTAEEKEFLFNQSHKK